MTERVAVAELCRGRVLAEELAHVTATRGLAQGTVLDDGLIELIRRTGVPSVLVRKSPTGTGDGSEPPELTAEVDRRFRHARGRPAMEALREAVIRFRRAVDGTRC